MTSDYYLAQDICQETFLKLYGYMGRLDERGVKRWLYVVSYNKTCDWIRRSKKYHELIEENSDLLVRGADDPVDRYAAWTIPTGAIISFGRYVKRTKSGTRF